MFSTKISILSFLF